MTKALFGHTLRCRLELRRPFPNKNCRPQAGLAGCERGAGESQGAGLR